MREAVWFCACLIVLTTTAAFAQEPPAPDEGLVLDQTCTWRQFHTRGMMRISADALTSAKEEDKVLDERLTGRLEKETRRHCAARGIAIGEKDWRDFATTFFARRDAVDEGGLHLMPTELPAADWAKPEFDDTDWIRQKIMPLPHDRGQPFPDLYTYISHLRTTFVVPDPSKVSELKLELMYRGGVRVFVNGAEVARQNLPAGELAPLAKAADYPEAAYRAFIDEVPDPPRGRRCIADLRFDWEHAAKPDPRRGPQFAKFRDSYQGNYINEKGWRRVKDLRDRTLGPISIPGKLLRKGANVLALEVRASPFHPIILPGAGGERFNNDNWAWGGGWGNRSWAHARLIACRLVDPSKTVPAVMERPPGVQVWVEDMHVRMTGREFNQPGAPTGTIRLAGALKGHYSAQLAVGTDAELKGLKVACGDLKGPGGTIPAKAFDVGYLVARPLAELAWGGYGRGLGCSPMNKSSVDTILYASGNPAVYRADNGKYLGEELAKLSFFDEISPDAPAAVPAGTAQPVWIGLTIPADARPGNYTGQVTVSADGAASVTVPVEVEVIDWMLPDAKDFQADALLEQSPYGIAKATGCTLWSDEHFRLIEESFKQLARVGNDLVYVPVLQFSELGNHKDGMIKWTRRKDGSFAFDYAIMDRYLDLAVKHLGKPKVISFVVMHWMRGSAAPTVAVFDEAAGKVIDLPVGWDQAVERLPVWRAFAMGLAEHVRARGLADSMYWGNSGDQEGDPGLIGLLSDLFPDIYWTAAAHSRRGGSGGGGHDIRVFRCMAEIYAKPIRVQSMMGWLVRDTIAINTLNPRNFVSGISAPYQFRITPPQASHMGYTGMGRMGFDYYQFTWNDGYRGGDWNPPGMSVLTMSWPGAKGIHGSARFETFIEGVQETEARIFMEQVIQRKGVAGDLAGKATQTIIDHVAPGVTPQFEHSTLSLDTLGWRRRSADLYRMAKTVADAVGMDVDKAALAADVPALGKKVLSVKCRNWTPAARKFTAAADVAWIVPAAKEGAVAGHQDFAVTLDGTKLKIGDKLEGTLTITDTATGTAWPVKVSAAVTAPMDLLYVHPNFNVPVGGKETRAFRVVNNAAGEQSWSLKADLPWITVAPSSGTLAPGKSVFVNVTAAPTDQGPAEHHGKLVFDAAGGLVNREIDSRTFVIPEFKAPPGLPFGRVLKIEQVDAKLVVSHKTLGMGDEFYPGSGFLSRQGSPVFGHKFSHDLQPIIGKKRFDRAMWVAPYHETVYNMDGQDIEGFAAYVGVPVEAARSFIRHHDRRVNFEVWADGKVVAQSGLMTTQDEPRLLVARFPDGAKQVKLVTRLDSCRDSNAFLAIWANGEFYKKR